MLKPNQHIRVHDLNSDSPFSYYVARSADDGANDHDRSMIATAIAHADTIASGGMVYEFFTEPTLRLVDVDDWDRFIYRFVDRYSIKKLPSRYADVDGHLHVLSNDGEPMYGFAPVNDHWIIDLDGELHPPKNTMIQE